MCIISVQAIANITITTAFPHSPENAMLYVSDTVVVKPDGTNSLMRITH